MVEHLTSYTLSPTDRIVRRSTWEGERHKTKTHSCVTRAGCVDNFRKNDRYIQLDDFSCNGIFANVVYTHSVRDVRVRLGLVALPFPSRASGDKIRGRYGIRREMPNQDSKAGGGAQISGGPNFTQISYMFTKSQESHSGSAPPRLN